MSAVTRFVLAHRRLVVAFWVVLTIVGIATVGKANESFSEEFSVPGRRPRSCWPPRMSGRKRVPRRR